EHELHEPAPERGPVDALAGAREEHLLDQVAEVLVVGALAGASASAESEREVDVHGQVPITRGCVPLTMGGPCGAWSAARQRPTLVWRITGERFPLTRTAGTSHCTRTHGCGAPETLKTQPTIGYWSASVAAGWPLRSTRGPAGTSSTVPAWGQRATIPTWSRGPGMGSSPT